MDKVDRWAGEQKEGNRLDEGYELNKEIEKDEVAVAIGKLKIGKATGIDGICGEILKFGGPTLVEAVWRLCKEIFFLERIPVDWARGLIFPIHKSGDKRLPTNYRGITLLSVVGKVYATILNDRLMEWCESRHVLVEEQAGFRRGRSTIDHIFVLTEAIASRKSKRRATFCAFLDIQKAYDTVFRQGVWSRLLDIGVYGKLWRVIRNLYEVVESSVLLGEVMTDWFGSKVGLRQGCVLAPLLFLIFIDGLARVVKQAGGGVKVGDDLLNILLFADDIVLIADNPAELQKLLDAAYDYSRKWRFKFNIQKSNVVVFSGAHRPENSVGFYLGFQKMCIVDSYRYLGVVLSSNLSWKHHIEALYKKAYRRLVVGLEVIRKGLMFEAANNFWGTMIRPIMEYGAEVWGRMAWPEAETAQNLMGTNLLGVSSKTTLEAVRGELGWWTMKARRDVCILRFWGKIISGNKSSLVSKVYHQRRLELKTSQRCWCGYVRTLLSDLHLDAVWKDQVVPNDWNKVAMKAVHQREITRWLRNLDIKPKLRLYRRLKRDPAQEQYLTYMPLRQRKYLTMIRSGTSTLRIETGRWAREPVEQRTCRICATDRVEDEHHVVLDCPAYNADRESLFHQLQEKTGLDPIHMDPDRLLEVLLGGGLDNADHVKIIYTEVAKFLGKLFCKRQTLISKNQDNNDIDNGSTTDTVEIDRDEEHGSDRDDEG